MNTNLTFDQSGTGPAGSKAARAPLLTIIPIHTPRLPAIPNERRWATNMRSSLLLAMLAMGCISFAHGDDAAPDTAEELSRVVLQAESVTVDIISKNQPSEFTFVDKEWISRLSVLLEATSYKPRAHCWCISFPRIRLNSKGEPICRLSVHHGDRLRANGGKLAGDFFIGKDAGNAFIKLIEEKTKG